MSQAIAGGHSVVAVARNPGSLPSNVRAVRADLRSPDAEALRGAIDAGGAVLSSLGPRSRTDVGIAEIGTRAIIDAMRARAVRRIVVVSAAPIGTVPSPRLPSPPRHDPGDGFLMRHLLSPIIKAMLRRHYADLALMEDLLRDSGLDWTIVRPPRLTDQALTERYRTATGRNLRGGLTISRANVAHLMLKVLGQPETIRQVIGIAR
jgi:nucleoside-diphosphate-sugar epimerase